MLSVNYITIKLGKRESYSNQTQGICLHLILVLGKKKKKKKSYKRYFGNDARNLIMDYIFDDVKELLPISSGMIMALG